MLAKYISAITSPFVVTPIFGLWVIAQYSKSLNDFFLWGITFLILIILCPLIFILYKIKKGEITDLHISLREQRDKPFLFTTITSLLLIIVYKIENAPYVLFCLAFVLFINSLIFYLITKFWKISGHSAVFCGSVLIVSILINPKALFFLILLPLIIWARTKREKHNFWQGIVAILVVSIVTLLVFNLLKII
ncbi:MAG: hypothetical protein WC662_03445 [Candidatus Paceibacterota bacterium]|jgi:MFS family permease